MSAILFCCPFAGAGASFYRSWAPPANSGIRIVPVQLPGREEQFTRPAHQRMEEAAADVLDQVQAAAAPDDDLALFGHSFGAALAFDVARRLVARGGHRLVRLFVSGSAEPLTPLEDDSSGLRDDEFVARVAEIAGFSHPALADPQLRQILLPALRADVHMRESYRPGAVAPLPVPVTAVRGETDHLVSAEDCAGWARVTSVGCDVREVPGDHLYLAEDPGPLLELIAEVLSGAGLPGYGTT
ncbi:thioesterase II family protein [Actinophytocola oryzae]|uniref:Surfactin synthase thioesterase subunit n=1 Tax=Actinophytocola oryzae TaxID=502181 RepID=A0A4R7URT5_9PSEU|nr:alpha/beta fold hydrolase [Actinophytocola oryzae]TDV37797.1 surfactin synthase thioesterase subunit [Actinophytocola oryzae]